MLWKGSAQHNWPRRKLKLAYSEEKVDNSLIQTWGANLNVTISQFLCETVRLDCSAIWHKARAQFRQEFAPPSTGIRQEKDPSRCLCSKRWGRFLGLTSWHRRTAPNPSPTGKPEFDFLNNNLISFRVFQWCWSHSSSRSHLPTSIVKVYIDNAVELNRSGSLWIG